MNRIGILLCNLSLLLLFGWVIRASGSPPVAFAANEARVSPDFSLVSSDGNTVSLKDFRGKVVYLDFWASWCVPCRITLPWMQQLQARFRARGLEVVAVNVDVKRADAEQLLEGIHPKFTVLFDPEGAAAEKFELTSMPSSFLVDQHGRIVQVHSGFRDGDDKVLEAQIEKLLQERS